MTSKSRLTRFVSALLIIGGITISVVGAATETVAHQLPGTASLTLKSGEYLWHPEISPSGPVVLVISLDEQRAYVYRNGIAIGVSTISSGRRGKETPTGVFTILQKNRDHRSNIYDNAPMPFMQRLTWDGIALHGGIIPGYPASHGCVRLPRAFAEKLFAITKRGDTVVVADAKVSPLTLVYPSMLAPVSSVGQAISYDLEHPGYSWNSVIAPDGPVSIVVSVSDRRIYVVRNGTLIGEAAFETAAPNFQFHGTVLYVMEGNPSNTNATASTTAFPDEAIGSTGNPSRTMVAQEVGNSWTTYQIQDGSATAPNLLDRATLPMWLPEGFSNLLSSVLVPGTTLLLTDMPAVRLPVLQDVDAGNHSDAMPVLESEQAGATNI